MQYIFSLAVIAIAISGCATTEVRTTEKSVWCNTRYLANPTDKPVANKLHLDVAKQGYLYAFLGAHVLQKDNSESEEHKFVLPRWIQEVDIESDSATGFKAKTYEVYSFQSPDYLQEVVIAFAGTDGLTDWFHNLWLLKTKQYDQAVEYVKKITQNQKYVGKEIVVTGYSLGGGLSAHVVKNQDSGKLVDSAWVFNPSPKIWADSSENIKIWQASSRSDALKFFRLPIWRILPGLSKIGVNHNQRAEDFYLIESNSIYAHFRWVLARNMLHMADLAFSEDEINYQETSEPLELLKLSKFKKCE